jgi:hypothetical protein
MLLLKKGLLSPGILTVFKRALTGYQANPHRVL